MCLCLRFSFSQNFLFYKSWFSEDIKREMKWVHTLYLLPYYVDFGGNTCIRPGYKNYADNFHAVKIFYRTFYLNDFDHDVCVCSL